jgi:hypothetical protein
MGWDRMRLRSGNLKNVFVGCVQDDCYDEEPEMRGRPRIFIHELLYGDEV